MKALIILSFVIPIVLVGGFLLAVHPLIIGGGGPFGNILFYGIVIGLIPGVFASLGRAAYLWSLGKETPSQRPKADE
jgi:hypothetical protein